MKTIKVGLMWYPVTALGYGRRIGVWFQGCRKRCGNCISPEFQSREGGLNRTAKEILDIAGKEAKVDGLTVSGGEPFDQPEGLLELVKEYKKRVNGDILVFTGYTLDELHGQGSAAIEEVLDNIAVLVDGAYVEEENNGIGLRGSGNQRIYVRNYGERYAGAESAARNMQCVLMEDRLWMIGIPPK